MADIVKLIRRRRGAGPGCPVELRHYLFFGHVHHLVFFMLLDAQQPRPAPPRPGDQLRDRERIHRTVERFIPLIVLFPGRHPAPAAFHDFFMLRGQCRVTRSAYTTAPPAVGASRYPPSRVDRA